MITMESRLQKWGNSDGVRIPKAFLQSLNLKTNDKIIIEQVDDKIVISKCNKDKISLKELFDEYHGKNIAKEFEWDDARGREIW
ncbi:MAG: AbrB/MazE/SpoVT family DNA-binding domain-containing protein [Bacilli bacterium]|nr:AbrB/MazE/SpoVT family DNA-binding domain-containing protein [Bacilli bacterium]